jgi:hypothetical protein
MSLNHPINIGSLIVGGTLVLGLTSGSEDAPLFYAVAWAVSNSSGVREIAFVCGAIAAFVQFFIYP